MKVVSGEQMRAIEARLFDQYGFTSRGLDGAGGAAGGPDRPADDAGAVGAHRRGLRQGQQRRRRPGGRPLVAALGLPGVHGGLGLPGRPAGGRCRGALFGPHGRREHPHAGAGVRGVAGCRPDHRRRAGHRRRRLRQGPGRRGDQADQRGQPDGARGGHPFGHRHQHGTGGRSGGPGRRHRHLRPAEAGPLPLPGGRPGRPHRGGRHRPGREGDRGREHPGGAHPARDGEELAAHLQPGRAQGNPRPGVRGGGLPRNGRGRGPGGRGRSAGGGPGWSPWPRPSGRSRCWPRCGPSA